MTVHVRTSNEVRLHWRQMLDGARAGEHIVVEHRGTPVGVIIPYEDYVAIQESLREVRAMRNRGPALTTDIE